MWQLIKLSEYMLNSAVVQYNHFYGCIEMVNLWMPDALRAAHYTGA